MYSSSVLNAQVKIYQNFAEMNLMMQIVNRKRLESPNSFGRNKCNMQPIFVNGTLFTFLTSYKHVLSSFSRHIFRQPRTQAFVPKVPWVRG